MIEEKISLAVQHLVDRSRQYLVVVAMEPQVRMLPEILVFDELWSLVSGVVFHQVSNTDLMYDV